MEGHLLSPSDAEANSLSGSVCSSSQHHRTSRRRGRAAPQAQDGTAEAERKQLEWEASLAAMQRENKARLAESTDALTDEARKGTSPVRPLRRRRGPRSPVPARDQARVSPHPNSALCSPEPGGVTEVAESAAEGEPCAMPMTALEAPATASPPDECHSPSVSPHPQETVPDGCHSLPSSSVHVPAPERAVASASAQLSPFPSATSVQSSTSSMRAMDRHAREVFVREDTLSSRLSDDGHIRLPSSPGAAALATEESERGGATPTRACTEGNATPRSEVEAPQPARRDEALDYDDSITDSPDPAVGLATAADVIPSAAVTGLLSEPRHVDPHHDATSQQEPEAETRSGGEGSIAVADAHQSPTATPPGKSPLRVSQEAQRDALAPVHAISPQAAVAAPQETSPPPPRTQNDRPSDVSETATPLRDTVQAGARATPPSSRSPPRVSADHSAIDTTPSTKAAVKDAGRTPRSFTSNAPPTPALTAPFPVRAPDAPLEDAGDAAPAPAAVTASVPVQSVQVVPRRTSAGVDSPTLTRPRTASSQPRRASQSPQPVRPTSAAARARVTPGRGGPNATTATTNSKPSGGPVVKRSAGFSPLPKRQAVVSSRPLVQTHHAATPATSRGPSHSADSQYAHAPLSSREHATTVLKGTETYERRRQAALQARKAREERRAAEEALQMVNTARQRHGATTARTKPSKSTEQPATGRAVVGDATDAYPAAAESALRPTAKSMGFQRKGTTQRRASDAHSPLRRPSLSSAPKAGSPARGKAKISADAQPKRSAAGPVGTSTTMSVDAGRPRHVAAPPPVVIAAQRNTDIPHRAPSLPQAAALVLPTLSPHDSHVSSAWAEQASADSPAEPSPVDAHRVAMFCTSCGEKYLADTARFCAFCGHKREGV